MRQLNGVYTQRFNRRHGRVGYVFLGRFKAILVERDSYLLELCRYVVLNPVRAAMVKSVERYRWSSYPAIMGLIDGMAWLHTDWILAQFGKYRAVAPRRYGEFVAQDKGLPSPWPAVRGQAVLGPDDFVETMRPLLDNKDELKEISRAQRFLHRPSLAELLTSHMQSEKIARRGHEEGVPGIWLQHGGDWPACRHSLLYGWQSNCGRALKTILSKSDPNVLRESGCACRPSPAKC